MTPDAIETMFRQIGFDLAKISIRINNIEKRLDKIE